MIFKEEKTMITKNNCPECGSNNYKKNGHTHNGKQNHQCKDCGSEFVLNPEKEIISDEKKQLAKHYKRELPIKEL